MDTDAYYTIFCRWAKHAIQLDNSVATDVYHSCLSLQTSLTIFSLQLELQRSVDSINLNVHKAKNYSRVKRAVQVRRHDV